MPRKGLFVDRDAIRSESKRLLAMVGLSLDPDLLIEDISQHEAQLVEIAKVLGTMPCILVMDEPTSALSQEEVDRLFEIIRNLKNRGLAIVYISHHLPEIYRIADRVTVMRDGKKVGTENIASASRETVVQMMVGRSVKEFYSRSEHEIGETRLEIEGLSRYGYFHDVSFSARKGEILGICGLSGAGRSELARVICGLDGADEGTIRLDGEAVPAGNMDDRVALGIGYLTEDRKYEGVALRLSVEDNILSAIIPRLSKHHLYRKQDGMSAVKDLIEELSIYPPDPGRTVANLSGGNQQKVLLAKWMATEPRVLVLDEPTRGVDIGAKMIIHDAIERLAERGNTVLLISSDLPELVGLSDRVMIMRKGHFIKEMSQDVCSEESLLLAANGEGGE
jgi:ABC-type sugar transport system ATPase subunit